MAFLIGLVLLVALFLCAKVGIVCFAAAVVVAIFGVKKGLSLVEDKTASRRALLWTAVITLVLVGLGIYLLDLYFWELVF